MASRFLKFLINSWYRHTPKCFCGYNMKPKESTSIYKPMTWYCVWKKQCGWETFMTTNGKLRWWKS